MYLLPSHPVLKLNMIVGFDMIDGFDTIDGFGTIVGFGGSIFSLSTSHEPVSIIYLLDFSRYSLSES